MKNYLTKLVNEESKLTISALMSLVTIGYFMQVKDGFSNSPQNVFVVFCVNLLLYFIILATIEAPIKWYWKASTIVAATTAPLFFEFSIDPVMAVLASVTIGLYYYHITPLRVESIEMRRKEIDNLEYIKQAVDKILKRL